ncbi:Flp pilus assembly protein CpaB [Streptomyces sp. NPDC093225]|uniref:Flp pilus assembly protein CpaB n=1 Tax=Streptomyces sp. NPDC093225 TaxID=3366034 RepID=UPI0038201FB6
MNSRQRRGVILLLLSVLCALGAFFGVLSVIGDVNSKVGPEVVAYRVRGDIAPYTELGPADFEKIKIPKRWLPDNAVTDLAEVREKTVLTTLKAGSLLQDDMFVDRPQLKPGEQEISVKVDAEPGVAGKIRPGDRVTVIATFKGKKDGADVSKIMVADARVLGVGKATVVERGAAPRSPSEAVPVTFALEPKDVQRVVYADTFAEHLRLALVVPGSTTSLSPGDRTYTLEGDK